MRIVRHLWEWIPGVRTGVRWGNGARRVGALTAALLTLACTAGAAVAQTTGASTFTPLGDRTPYDDVAYDAFVQPDGRIVVAGMAADYLASLPAEQDHFMAARYNADGSLDTSYGEDGVALVDVGAGDQARAAVMQPDGKVVIVGTSAGDFTAVRLTTAGAADTSFGGDGIVTVDIGRRGANSSDHATSVALGADGKITIGGDTWERGVDDFEFAAVRLNPDGSPDTAFSEDGRTFIDLNGDHTTEDLQSGDDIAHAVAVQADGSTLLAGESARGSADEIVGLVRLTPAGAPDPTFGTGGVVRTDLGYAPTIHDALALPQGGFVLAGGIHPDRRHGIIARFDNAGALDRSFGASGIVRTNWDRQTRVDEVRRLAGGDLLVGGVAHLEGGRGRMVVARYSASGEPSLDFGVEGWTEHRYSSHSETTGLAIDTQGGIVAAGYARNDVARYGGEYDIGFLRLNRDGELDSGFSDDGTLLADLGLGALDAGAQASLRYPDGRILVAGSAWNRDSSSFDTTLVRYLASGELDPGFGGGDGIVISELSNPGRSEGVADVALNESGSVLVAGSANTGNGSVQIVARFTAAGQLDSAFDGDGRLLIHNGLSSIRALEVLPDGSLLAGFAWTEIRKYAPGGQPVLDFGGGDGVARPGGQTLSALAVRPDGGIVAAGNGPGSTSDPGATFYAAGLTADGEIDPGFGTGGSTLLGGEGGSATSVSVEGDGSIALSGYQGEFQHADFAVGRLHPNGLADSAFGGDGYVSTDLGQGIAFPDDHLALSDEGLIAAGVTDLGTRAPRLAMVRYERDGTLSPDFGEAGRFVAGPEWGLTRGIRIFAGAAGQGTLAGTGVTDSGSVFSLTRLSFDEPGSGPVGEEPPDEEGPAPNPPIEMPPNSAPTEQDSSAAAPPVAQQGAIDTGIDQGPRRVQTKRRRARVSVAFSSDDPAATFECAVDEDRWRPCVSPRSFRLERGRHVISVRAVSSAGTIDETPATHRVRVLRP